MKQEDLEAKALTKDPKERLLYVAGYRSCLNNLKQWLMKNKEKYIYDFLKESEG